MCVVFFKINVGIVLPNFPIIYKMVCKSLSKCESKVENENKMFTSFLVSATRNLFPRSEMLRSQGYFKDATTKYLLSVCQHISAFLGGVGVGSGSTFHTLTALFKYKSKSPEEKGKATGQWRTQVIPFRNPPGENCPG